MAAPTQSAPAEPRPTPAEVREQLRRLLAHPLFTNSRRYPVLLSYAVERALDGHAGELKERVIGVEAFGRKPDYDVSLDPVVRSTAAEVRKRLVQYYYNSDHASELVIELPLGSYIPLFRPPPAWPPARTAEPGAVAVREPLSSGRRRRLRPVALLGVTALIALVAGIAIGRYRPVQPTSNLQRFWSPITTGTGRITYCLGEPLASQGQPLTPEGLPIYGNLDASDVTTLARSLMPLTPANNAFRVRPASKTSFAQLREGPVVLIGAFDNPWTMRVMKDLPVTFQIDGNQFRILDRRGSEPRNWQLAVDSLSSHLDHDYAVVARLRSSVTGQPVIVLGGIWGEGTEAASEAATNPAYLEAVLARAPKNWEQLNLAAVIETPLVEGHPGPPSVLAVETW